MKSFKQYKINESLEKVQPWKWTTTRHDDYTAEFNIQDKKYVINLTELYDRIKNIHYWYLDFYLDLKGARKQNITNTGDQFTIFATVLDIINNFIKKESPDIISFDSKKIEKSRISLYQKMIKKYTHPDYMFSNNLNLSTFDVKKFQEFTLIKKSYYNELQKGENNDI